MTHKTILTCIALVAMTLCPLGAAPTTVFADSFEKHAVASRDQNWTGSYRIENIGGVTCLSVGESGTIERKFKAVGGQATFDYEVMAPGPGVTMAAPYLKNGSVAALKFAFVNGSFRLYQGGGTKTLSKVFPAGTWVKIRLEVDFPAQKCSVTLNGEPAGEAIGFTEPATGVDNVHMRVSLRSFSVRYEKVLDAATVQAREGVASKKASWESRAASHPSPLVGAWVRFLVRQVEAALEKDEHAKVRDLQGEIEELLALPAVKRMDAGPNLFPPIPDPAQNAFWPPVQKRWAQVRDNTAAVEVKGYVFKISDEMQQLAFAFMHPSSPLRDDPKALGRLLIHLETLMDQWAQGKYLVDFACDQEIPQVYVMLKTVYPGLLTATRRARWENLIRTNADLIMAQRGDIYLGQKQYNLWINGDIRHAVSLAWSALALDEKRYREAGDQAMVLMGKAQFPDGGWAYVGYQNEAFSYHSENLPALAWYHIATGIPEVMRQMKAARPYYPISWHPRGIGDYTTATMMKQYWNMGRPDIGALIPALVNGCGFNMTAAEVGKQGRNLDETPPHLLGLFMWKGGIEPRPFPDNWMIYDRNTAGPRGRWGDFMAVATTRDASAVTGPAQDWDGKLIGNMTSSFVGAIALRPLAEVDAAMAANPAATDRRWPLGTALQNVTCEVKIEKGADTDVSRRGKHRFMAQHIRAATASAPGFGTVAAVYKITDKLAGGDATFKPLPWEGHQAWIITKERVVGLMALEATEDHENWGVHGTLMMVGGRESWGNKWEIKETSPGAYVYGNMAVKVHQHDFAGFATEYTDAFTGKNGKSSRVILWDRPMDPDKETLAVSPKGTRKFWLMESRPTTSAPALGVTRLTGLSGGAWGFRLEEEGRSLIILHNPTGSPVKLDLSLPAKRSMASWHPSADHSWRVRNIATWETNPKTEGLGGGDVSALPVTGGAVRVNTTLAPWAHGVVAISDDGQDHLRNDQTFESVFK